MKTNSERRNRRAKKTRGHLRTLNMPRLSVHISLQHIYAQILTPDGAKVLAVASTLDKEVKSLLEKKGVNIKSAAIVGKLIAKRATVAGVKKIGFDRSGFKYHGRVKALADAARENGLDF
jgi:large subunit ribosomal protein L18